MMRFTFIECSWKILQNFNSVIDKKYVSKIITLPFYRYVVSYLSTSTQNECVTGALHGISKNFYSIHSVLIPHFCKQPLLLRFLGRNNFQCFLSNPLIWETTLPCSSHNITAIYFVWQVVNFWSALKSALNSGKNITKNSFKKAYERHAVPHLKQNFAVHTILYHFCCNTSPLERGTFRCAKARH